MDPTQYIYVYTRTSNTGTIHYIRTIYRILGESFWLQMDIPNSIENPTILLLEIFLCPTKSSIHFPFKKVRSTITPLSTFPLNHGTTLNTIRII